MTFYRVLVITNMWPHEADPSYGSFVQDQMESLRPLGVEYDVLFINGRKSRWNYLRAVSEMRRRLRTNRFDLIHAQFGLAGCVARCQRRVPVAVSFHGDDVLGKFDRDGRITLYGRLLRWSSFVLSRLVSVNIVQSAEMRSQLGSDRAIVIPCGVDLALFQPFDRDEARRRLGLDLKKKFVLFAYNPSETRKRYDLVRAAVSRAREIVPELDILHVSGQPHKIMPLYMSAADMLVLPSMIEGSPVALKEAMATNLPIIAADVGDAADLIGPTEGCHVVPRDVEAIAAKIVEVSRRGARTRGREWIARLSIENIAQQVFDVYSDVLRSKRSAQGTEQPG